MVKFKRLENGDVEVSFPDYEAGFGSPGGVPTEVVNSGHWISDFLNTTVFSERANDWPSLMAHFRGERDVLQPVEKLEAFKKGYETALKTLAPLNWEGETLTEQEQEKVFFTWWHRELLRT